MNRQYKLVLTAIGFLICAAAFLRGRYLLGTSAAITFCLLVAASMFVVQRVFVTNQPHTIARRTIASLFAATVFILLWFASNLDSGVASISHRHRTLVRLEAQLHDVLADTPRFRRVHATCDSKKMLFVTIAGRVESQADLMELRARLIAECPDINQGSLYWRLSVDESNKLHNGCDSDIFGDVNQS